MVFGDAGVGLSCQPFPFVGLGLVVLLEFFDEQVGQVARLGMSEQGLRDIGRETIAQLEFLASASDIMREVFGASVPEVVEIAVSVFLVRRLVPDFTNLVSDSVSNRLPLHQTIQHEVSFLLGETLAGHQFDCVILAVEGIDAGIDSTRSELEVERRSVLTHEVDALFHDARSVGADDTEQSNHQRDLHRTIEGIADAQAELEVILPNLEPDILEFIIRIHPRTAIGDHSLASEAETLLGEEVFGTTNQVLVLDERVAVSHSLEALARVSTDIAEELRLLPIGKVEANLLDLVERVVRVERFGDCGLEFHIGVFWIQLRWQRSLSREGCFRNLMWTHQRGKIPSGQGEVTPRVSSF